MRAADADEGIELSLFDELAVDLEPFDFNTI